MAQVLLSGASGMLGRAISSALEQQGMSVVRLVRHVAVKPDEVFWDPAGPGIEKPEILEGLNAAIHLSGANVASHRWTAAYKIEIGESRVTTTRVLAEALAGLKSPPPVLIAASAVGFYGDRGDEILNESSPRGAASFPLYARNGKAPP